MDLVNVGCSAPKIVTQEDEHEDNAAKRKMKHCGVERCPARIN